MSKLKKYKTSLYELHKYLNDITTKKELEKDIKSIVGFEKYDNETLDNLIIVVYLVADEMNVRLRESIEWQLGKQIGLRKSRLLETKSPVHLRHEKRYRDRWLASINNFKNKKSL